jgi:Domain of unknown function (DUF4397)
MAGQLPRVAAALFGLGLVLTSVACGGGSGQAQLRVLLAAPSISSVDVYVDDKSVFTSLAYGANTGYITVISGTRHLQILPAGSTSNPIVDEQVTSPTSGEETVVIEGISPNISGVILTDNSTAPAADTAMLRLINAAPNMGTADVYVVAAGSSLISGQPTVPELAYGAVSSYQTLTIPTTSTTQVFSVFFTKPGTTQAVLDTGPITFSSGQNRTLIALNNLNGGFTFVTLADLD